VGGNLTQSDRVVTTTSPLVVIAGGAITLNDATNSIQNFTAYSSGPGDITLVNASGSQLDTNAITNTNGGVSITSATVISVNDLINATGDVTIKSTGGLVPIIYINDSVSGNNITLEAWNGVFNYGGIQVAGNSSPVTVNASGVFTIANASDFYVKGNTNALYSLGHADVKASGGMNINLQGDLYILGGINNSDALLQNLGGNQVINANAVKVYASSDSEGRLNNFGGNQSITANGDLSGYGINVLSDGTDPSAVAEIFHSGSGSQTLTINNNIGSTTQHLAVKGSVSGAADALISSSGTQNINMNAAASNILLNDGGAAVGSSIIRAGNMNIDAGGNSVTITGGPGIGSTTGLDSTGTLTLVNAAGISISGGSGGTGTKAGIRAGGDLVLGTVANPVSTLVLNGATSGADMDAIITSTAGAVNIYSGSGTLVVTGGDTNGSESIIEGESVSITTAYIGVTGGNTATGNQALLLARNGDMNINATSLSLTPGTGVDSDAVVAAINGNPNLNVTVCTNCNPLPADPRLNGITEAGVYTGVAAVPVPTPAPITPPSSPAPPALIEPPATVTPPSIIDIILSLLEDAKQAIGEDNRSGGANQEADKQKVLICS